MDAALRGAGAQGDDTRDVIDNPHKLKSVKISSSQLHRGLLRPRGPSLLTRCWGIECQAKIHKQHSHVIVFLFQMGKAQVENKGDDKT